VKATRLLAVALASMFAGLGSGAMGVVRGAHQPKPAKTIALSRTVGSARNGGHGGGNRAAVRAAVKARNVKRHRAHLKGRAHA
jgi:hypothetical protein